MNETVSTNTFPPDCPFSLNVHRALDIARHRPEHPIIRPNDKAVSARRGLERRGSRSTSSFRGVTHHCRTGRWEAHIWEDGKQVYLGGFDTEEQASVAYDMAAVKCRGVEAITNFDISNYGRELKHLDEISKMELILSLREQSKSTTRRRPLKSKERRPRSRRLHPKCTVYTTTRGYCSLRNGLEVDWDVSNEKVTEVDASIGRRTSTRSKRKASSLLTFADDFDDDIEGKCSTWKLASFAGHPSVEEEAPRKKTQSSVVSQKGTEVKSKEPAREDAAEEEGEDLVSMLNFEIPFRDFDGIGADPMNWPSCSYEDDDIDDLF